MMLFIYISVSLEAHAVSNGGVPPGITACLARKCLQASAGVNGLTSPPLPSFAFAILIPLSLRSGNFL